MGDQITNTYYNHWPRLSAAQPGDFLGLDVGVQQVVAVAPKDFAMWLFLPRFLG